MSQWSTLHERVAGKWQIPLLVVSLAMLVGAFLRVRPGAAELPLDEALDYLDTTISGGMYERAIGHGDLLLGTEEYTDAQRAPIHLRLARARYGEARRNRAHTDYVGRRIVEHYQDATSYGLALSPVDLANTG